MKKKYLLGALMVSAIFFSLNSASANAAKISMPTKGTSYVRKGNTYNLHFKAPSKLTVTTKAKYTITNTSDWKCIPYKTSKNNTKVFYLRTGNYHLTVNKNAQIKTNYTKISSIRKSLETFPYKKYPSSSSKPTKIKLGQNVKGFYDMYHTKKYNSMGYYQFTINKDKKVTIDYSSMTVYQNAKTNIFNDNVIKISPVSNYYYEQVSPNIKGTVNHKKYSWNLTKGTYLLALYPARGRYQFKLTSSDAENIPAQSKITNIKATKDGIHVEYEKAANATGYGIYYQESKSLLSDGVISSYPGSVLEEAYPNILNRTIPTNMLINGQTYTIAVGTLNEINGEKIFGPISKPITFTYYVPTDNNQSAVKVPKIAVSYYDDGGGDEPNIAIKWNSNPNVNSYEIAYRLKGSQNWTTYLTARKDGDEITDPEDATGSDFKKGQVYEVRVRAYTGNLKSDWSEIKSTTVTLTPYR
ncbi:hypothetical protein J2Z60_001333 [Lactobacillus colini]|uniref:Fibronectin type-III domain-containing protein n=1 Tax=Lactobacillus colini TaxID=1819254 RepID=A0ABS4MFP1_9LACO|nr:fibronectin type III domain-containing protein [Lactobacillus colini]MBP2058156.1 hypothetical protein [Lactobacillus colini]